MNVKCRQVVFFYANIFDISLFCWCLRGKWKFMKSMDFLWNRDVSLGLLTNRSAVVCVFSGFMPESTWNPQLQICSWKSAHFNEIQIHGFQWNSHVQSDLGIHKFQQFKLGNRGFSVKSTKACNMRFRPVIK